MSARTEGKARRRGRRGAPPALVALVLALVIGLVGGGVVHLVSVLGVPRFAPRNGFVVAAELGGEGRFAALPEADPFLRSAVCRFSTERPVRAFAAGDVPHWSASVITREGVNVYSLNDRVALDGALDLVVLRSADLPRWREVLSEDVELVPVASEGAVVVVRSFAADPTRAAELERFFAGASCEVLPDA